jgi:hypothetical protein
LTNIFVSELSRWLWGNIVQRRLDRMKRDHEVHRVRYQRKVLMPTGCRRIDMYQKPWRTGGEEQLLRLTPEAELVVDQLIAEHVPKNYTQFASDEVTKLGEHYLSLLPSDHDLKARYGWKIFNAMIAMHNLGVQAR